MSAPVSLDPSVINNLSDKEKEELRQFVNTQTQRTRVQARTFLFSPVFVLFFFVLLC